MPHGGPQLRLLCGGLGSRVIDDLSDVMDRLLNKDIPPLRLHTQHASRGQENIQLETMPLFGF